MKIKDRENRVFEVTSTSCYPPFEDGSVAFYCGGFNYFVGKLTDEPVTHKIVNYGGLVGAELEPLTSATAREGG